jgi:hypothetical protein
VPPMDGQASSTRYAPLEPGAERKVRQHFGVKDLVLLASASSSATAWLDEVRGIFEQRTSPGCQCIVT